ncbi:type II secretion system secretin GspD [Paraburkholderia sp. BR10954]|uniref:type II secretion system secretin GspD n=1 Tax=Paraburkholderia sp. BR10954 TaxID=3236995 RepID=UPI0034D1D700
MANTMALSRVATALLLAAPMTAQTAHALVSENSVPQDQALKTLQSALRMQGFAPVQDHGVLKVVLEADTKLQGVPTYVGNAPTARGDLVITQVFALRNESANNLLPVLRSLVSPNNTVAAYPAKNTIVVTDYADNVRRIARIIADFDSAAGQAFAVVPLKNANAIDIAQQMNKMLDPGSIGSTDATRKVSISSDPRTNSLLMRASNTTRLAAAKELAKQLDMPTTMPGNIHVVPLRNADATKLARTLRSMLGKDGDEGSSGGSNDANSFNQNSTGGGMITADPTTNSVIITAPEATYRNLRAVIDQLDARRARVYIDALIVELNSNTSGNLGIQWQVANDNLFDGTNLAAGTGNSIINLTPAAAAGVGKGLATAPASSAAPVQQGPNIGWIHNTFGVQGLGGLLQALSQTADANVLSTPNLITLDNEEAKIIVGDNVPIQTGSDSNLTSGTTSAAFNTVDRADIGLTLHVNPQITDGGILKLQLYTEDSAIVTGTNNASTNPASPEFTKSSIQSTVLCDNGEIIVLGGLMQDDYRVRNSKVPLLGDIPWLGQLFRSEQKTRAKTNLMVFLRPVILSDRDTTQAVTANRYDYIQGVQGAYRSDNNIMRDRDDPVVPPMPLGPSQGGVPAMNLFDLNQMRRQQMMPQQVPPQAVPQAGAQTTTQPAPQTMPRNRPSSSRQAARCRARCRRERVRDADARANRALATSAER